MPHPFLIFTVCKGRVYPGSAGLGLNKLHYKKKKKKKKKMPYATEKQQGIRGACTFMYFCTQLLWWYMSRSQNFFLSLHKNIPRGVLTNCLGKAIHRVPAINVFATYLSKTATSNATSKAICRIRQVFQLHQFIAPDKKLFSTKKFWSFSYFLAKTCYGYQLEAPHWGTSNGYPEHVLWRNKKHFHLNTLL